MYNYEFLNYKFVFTSEALLELPHVKRRRSFKIKTNIADFIQFKSFRFEETIK